MARYSKTEQAEALARLREWLKPSDTVYTLVTHVSGSGMSRAIRFIVPVVTARSCDCHSFPETEPHFIGKPTVDFIHPNHAIATVLGLRFHTRRGHQTDSLVVHGCGMDMCWHTVEQLSSALGYKVHQRSI